MKGPVEGAFPKKRPRQRLQSFVGFGVDRTFYEDQQFVLIRSGKGVFAHPPTPEVVAASDENGGLF